MERSKLPLFSLEPRWNRSASVEFPKSRDQTIASVTHNRCWPRRDSQGALQTVTLLAGTAIEQER